jgi:hypothetical protein
MKCTLTLPTPRYQVLCVCTAPAIPSLPAGAAAHRPHQTRLPSRDPSTSNPPLTTHPTCTVLTRKPQPSPTPWISSIDIVSHDFHPVSAATGPQLNYPVSDQPTISSLVPFLHGSHFTQTQQPVGDYDPARDCGTAAERARSLTATVCRQRLRTNPSLFCRESEQPSASHIARVRQRLRRYGRQCA